MNLFLIERYLKKIKKEDINHYATSQNINLTEKELDIIYTYFQTNYKTFLYSKELRPKLLTELKSKLSLSLSYKIDELYNRYKNKI